MHAWLKHLDKLSRTTDRHQCFNFSMIDKTLTLAIRFCAARHHFRVMSNGIHQLLRDCTQSPSIPRVSFVHVPPELERIPKGDGKAPWFSSQGEVGYLTRLVEKHREDVEAMARDLKLNPY